MVREHFISSADSELESIRKAKLSRLMERRKMSGSPMHVTDGNFDELTKKNSLALIDFWASWCGPCQALAPTIEELAREYEGQVFIGKLNVDENPKTAEAFQVFSIPTLIVTKNGKEVDRIVGCVPKRMIEETLKRHKDK